MRLGLVVPFLAVGVLLIAVSIPLLMRRVGPNPVFGLRVPATFADPWVWYEANARSARDLVVLAVILIVVALALAPVRALTDDAYAACFGVLLGVGGVTAAVIGWRRANHMLEQRREEESRS